MRRRLAIGSLLLAWLCANGAVWDVVQVIAWTRMFAGYAETLPVEEALQRTLDPSKPCPMCRMVQKAREAGREQQPGNLPARERDAERLVWVAEAVPVVVLAPPDREWNAAPDQHGERRVERVPVPPPRA